MPFHKLALALTLCLLTFGFGSLFTPGEWYASLNRAPWSPPNIAFPTVWSILYLFIAISGWQIFSLGSRCLKQLWCMQLAFNAIWSWLFFAKHWPQIALLDILLLSSLLVILIIHCHKQKLQLSTVLLMPYLGWLLLATTLNVYIVLYN